MTNTEKATAIMKSNLDDDLKVELIGLIMNPQSPQTAYPMYGDSWQKRMFEDGNWWEKITCKPTTGTSPEEWDPGRYMYEKAQADNVMNNPYRYKANGV